jgi:hypothetical protein
MNGWTPERRARQSAAIRQSRPWEHPTGPKSEEGKARVSRNPYKGGTRAARLRNRWARAGDSLERGHDRVLQETADILSPHRHPVVLAALVCFFPRLPSRL